MPDEARAEWSAGALTASDRRALEILKTTLMVEGSRLSSGAKAWLTQRFDGPAAMPEYPTTGGLTLDLGSGVLVNAPVDEWYCGAASMSIVVDADDLWIEDPEGGGHRIVDVLPLPGYRGSRDELGRLVTQTCFSHADRIRLSPIVGCAYSCDYCDLPAERYRRREAEQLIAAMHVALDDTALPPKHLLVSGGSPGPAHISWFEDTIGQIVRACPLPVDVMMAPVADDEELVDRLVDVGVAGFSINLEVFSDGPATVHIRAKHRHARPGFDAFVRRAVDRLGSSGRVRSLILTGLEPAASTLEGVEHIAGLGADPVLSPFRPAPRTALAAASPPDLTETVELLDASRAIVARHGVRLGPACVACQHNALALPWDR